MIPALSIIILAFGWLLYETRFLTIRLHGGLYCREGDCCAWHLPDDAVTQEMKDELLARWTNLPKNTWWAFHEGNQSPLCGWGYAYQYRDFVPDCKVEMTLNNVRYKMEIKSPGILAQVMKANKLTKKQKEALWAKQELAY